MVNAILLEQPWVVRFLKRSDQAL